MITIISAVVNGDVTQFPVYIDLADLGASFFTYINGAGADIRMTDINGNPLAREVVAIDTGELHFKTDLSSTVDNVFCIYYGSGLSEPAPDSHYRSENVWSNGYLAVWHLNEGSTANNFDSNSDSIVLPAFTSYDNIQGFTMPASFNMDSHNPSNRSYIIDTRGTVGKLQDNGTGMIIDNAANPLTHFVQ